MRVFFRLISAVIVEAVYGHRVPSWDDPFVEMVDSAGNGTALAAGPAEMAVDFFPLCELNLILIKYRAFD